MGTELIIKLQVSTTKIFKQVGTWNTDLGQNWLDFNVCDTGYKLWLTVTDTWSHIITEPATEIFSW